MFDLHSNVFSPNIFDGYIVYIYMHNYSCIINHNYACVYIYIYNMAGHYPIYVYMYIILLLLIIYICMYTYTSSPSGWLGPPGLRTFTVPSHPFAPRSSAPCTTQASEAENRRQWRCSCGEKMEITMVIPW